MASEDWSDVGDSEEADGEEKDEETLTQKATQEVDSSVPWRNKKRKMSVADEKSSKEMAIEIDSPVFNDKGTFDWDIPAVVDPCGHYPNGALYCRCPFTDKLFRLQGTLNPEDHLCVRSMDPTLNIPNRPDCMYCHRPLTAKYRESVLNDEYLEVEAMHSLCPSMPEGIKNWPWCVNADCNVKKPE